MTSSHELYSLLVPLAQERLIVPRACVAEVVTWQAPEKMEGAPPWYLGTIHWSGRPVPVISFEAACGQSLPTPGTRTRIVIFVALSAARSPGGYFGVITQGFPQLVRVNDDVVKSRPEPQLSRARPDPVPGAHAQRVAADPGLRAPGADDHGRDAGQVGRGSKPAPASMSG